MDFHNLNIKSIKREAAESVELTFEIPDDLQGVFSFEPGQYITLALRIKDEFHRRAYSICSDIYSKNISVLVKKLEGGLVSTFINDQITVRDKIQLHRPSGEFKISLENLKDDEHIILIGAGSGITPLISMIVSVLKSKSNTTCHLVYGSRERSTIIYHSKLNRLKLVYKERLIIHHFLSNEQNIISSNIPNLEYHLGRIDMSFIERIIGGLQQDKVNGIYLCGPSMLIDKSIDRLKSITFPKRKIHREYFAAPELDEEEISFDFRVLPERKVYVKLKGEPLEITIDNDEDILRKLIDEGYDPPYSCLHGTCSTCKAKLISGEVKMRVDIGLEDDEIEKGYILTCQSIPTTTEVSCEYLNHK